MAPERAPKPQDSQEPQVFGEHAAQPEHTPSCHPVMERRHNPGKPSTIPCPPELAERPSTYLDGRVSLRLPVGVSPDGFDEAGPEFVRMTHPSESVSCSEWLTGAMVMFMAVAIIDDDPQRELAQLRDAFLAELGYSEVQFCSEHSDDAGRRGRAVFTSATSNEDKEPAAALVRVEPLDGQLVVVVWEVHPLAWIVIRETLQASADSLELRETRTGP